MAFLETCFVTGFVVPSGMAAAFATALAAQGQLDYLPVAAAAIGGGFAGDVTGYWIGRRGGQALREGQGMAARALAKHDATTGRFLSGHPFFSVTVARLVAFVRTVMPIASGVAGVRFGTFLLYEIPGLLAWAALYMGVGLIAGESWERAGSIVGGGWALVFAVAALVIWARHKRRQKPPHGAVVTEPSNRTGGEAEAVAERDAEAGHDPDPAPEAEPAPEPEPDPDPDPEPEAEPDPESDLEPRAAPAPPTPGPRP